MPPVGFEPIIPISERPQTYALDRAATGTGTYILTFLFIYILTYSMGRVLFEKLTGLQLVKKFPAFYGTGRFIAAFTSARHLSLS